MIRSLLILLGSLSVSFAHAQIHGNEWIVHSRQYWSFQIHADGLARIDSAALANAGFPVTTVDPRHIMLFNREKQVPIYVQGESDGVFNTGDFIEFRAQKNDAWLDEKLFSPATNLANPYYSFFNDTIRYYLTWDEFAPKERVKEYSDPSFDQYPMMTWFWSEAINSMTGRYFPGMLHATGATSGFYVSGEGYFHSAIMNAQQPGVSEVVVNVTTPRVYTGTGVPDAQVSTVAVGINDYGGNEHHLQISYGAAAPGTLMIDTIYDGFKVVRSSFNVPQSAMGATLGVRFKAIADLNIVTADGTPYRDQQTPSNIVVKYARDFNMGGLPFMRMLLPDDPAGSPANIAFNSFSGTPVIYAYGDTVRRIVPTLVAGQYKAIIPADPTNAETEAYIMSQTAATSITALSRVNGTGYFTDFASLAMDSALLIITHESLMSGANNYAMMRQTSPTNAVNTLVADVDELYDQFGGGIPKHSLSIRRYCKFLADTWASQPRALFLIGKSVQAHRLGNSTPSYRPDLSGAYANCLVPSFGHPSSDPCFTIGLNFVPNIMEMPVGRLSARTNQEIEDYIDKIETFESQPRAEWMKNILHFRGGFSDSETTYFGQLMSGMVQLAEDTCFGGKVSDFKKSASGVFQSASADSVRAFIEDEGVTLMTFMAHAFANGFDITIDDPTNYNWNGKYPMVLANSCYIGNVHLNTNTSQPERWVMMPGKGPIAFLASIDIGFAHMLASYSTGWYQSFSQTNYGKGIGEHMKHTAAGLLPASDLMYQNVVHTFTLQGDPTLILNSFEKPDYSVKAEEIFYDPEIVTADADSFQVKAIVTNIGKAVNDTIMVKLERSAPMLGSAQEFTTTLSQVYFKDTAYFNVPTMAFAGGAGPNTITVKVDLEPSEVEEMDDVGNNQVTDDLFITSGDLVPVYPYDFAIVPEPDPILKASTGDPLAPERTYIFQIDTTDLFNSSVLETASIVAPGGVVTWQPQSIYSLNSFQDSTVFFWRCTIDSVGNGGYNWYERSFQYITGKHGWGQAHYFQFKNDEYGGIVYDRPERDFDFFTGQRNLIAQVRGNAVGEPGFATKWSIGLQPIDYGSGCAAIPAFHVAVIDPNTFEPWWTFHPAAPPQGNPNGIDFGNVNNGTACRNRREGFFSFPMNNATSMNGMANMLTTGIPDGHHVLIFTYRFLQKDSIEFFSPSVVAALEGLGVDLGSLPDSVPFAMYIQKGDAATYAQQVGSTLTEEIYLSVWVDASTDQGVITTMNAGPAQAWHKLYWNDIPLNPGDSTRIVLEGISAGSSGAVVELFDLTAADDSMDISTINAQQYPYLRIKGKFHDIGNPDPDPSQIQRWQLLSSPAPECAIHPPLGYMNNLNGLFQGQDASVAIAVQNISEFDMDSLLMTAWIVGQNNVTTRIHYEVKQPLPAGEHLVDTIHFSTLGFGGANTLIIEANPIDTTTNQYDQLEQYHFNNIAHIRFNVEMDITNPLLDVTFDGMHILDGDIVSARPEIMVTLDDENPVLLMNSQADTANFKVYLTTPNAAQARLYFRKGNGEENMQFVPASGPENEAKIIYRPIFHLDGKYQLAVEAADQSNNQSGNNRYQVNFEVITRPTITEILNYPNPFTTSTRFAFTVTGHRSPTYMKIQILTVTGRVVREIGMDELGPIRVGRNMTDFAWDGTDQFGDRMGRGVYLYRVIAKLDGEDIEYRETSASQYFNKGFGKMYLLK